MDEHRVIRQAAESIEVEDNLTCKRFLFVVLRLGHDGDRTLTPSVEGSIEPQSFTEDLLRARSFAEAVMLKAGSIDRANP